MVINPSSIFTEEELNDLKAAHAVYAQKKEAILAKIVKSTSGKMNTLEVESAKKWYAFVSENPKVVTDTRYSVADFGVKLQSDPVVAIIEKLEGGETAVTKVARDTVSSDLRYYWSTAEDFYLDAAAEDPTIREKYKSLPSISPKRKSDTEIEKDFKKLEERRKKKNGDNTNPKV